MSFSVTQVQLPTRYKHRGFLAEALSIVNCVFEYLHNRRYTIPKRDYKLLL